MGASVRAALLLLTLVVVGCSQKSPEEVEAAKYDPPKMMTDAEAKAFEAKHPDPRNGGAIPPPPPGEATSH